LAVKALDAECYQPVILVLFASTSSRVVCLEHTALISKRRSQTNKKRSRIPDVMIVARIYVGGIFNRR
jgi:hypothetical protein